MAVAAPETLVRTRDVLVMRLPGRSRDPLEGQHKSVVVYCGVTATRGHVVAQLRDAADRLELGARG